MRFVHQHLEFVRRAVARTRREKAADLVAEGLVQRVLQHAHQLNRRVAALRDALQRFFREFAVGAHPPFLAVAGVGALALVLLFVFKRFFFEDESSISYITIVFLSVVLSVVSMCGDLAASTIKRNFGIKDFGKLLPGHGGIMDRFDSALFVMPVLYSAVYLMSNF